MHEASDQLGEEAVPPRILIVQPHRNYLAVLARRISQGGYRVSVAESVQAAIVELCRVHVDLVLAELRRPPFNGAELVTAIRNDASLCDIPILLFTGRSDDTAAIRALRDGADGVVRKPFHFEVLYARMARELQRKRAMDELRLDNAVLDARVVARAIAMGELKDRLVASEARIRLLQNEAAPRSGR